MLSLAEPGFDCRGGANLRPIQPFGRGGGGGGAVRCRPKHPLVRTSPLAIKIILLLYTCIAIARKHEITLGNRGTSILNGAPTAHPQQTAAAELGEGL